MTDPTERKGSDAYVLNLDMSVPGSGDVDWGPERPPLSWKQRLGIRFSAFRWRLAELIAGCRFDDY